LDQYTYGQADIWGP